MIRITKEASAACKNVLLITPNPAVARASLAASEIQFGGPRAGRIQCAEIRERHPYFCEGDLVGISI